jgi:hypothetical protein
MEKEMANEPPPFEYQWLIKARSLNFFLSRNARPIAKSIGA